MTEEYRTREYDDYTIPPYDPSLTSEERAAIDAEADRKIQEALEMIKGLQ